MLTIRLGSAYRRTDSAYAGFPPTESHFSTFAGPKIPAITELLLGPTPIGRKRFRTRCAYRLQKDVYGTVKHCMPLNTAKYGSALAGWQNEAGVRAALDAAQALVLPSFAEGLPVVAMEAMAAGRPVIGTYIAGTPELVLPGVNGWLVPAGDVPALAAAIRDLAATPAGRLETMGHAARQRVFERHDAGREAEKLAGLFAKAIQGGTGRGDPV